MEPIILSDERFDALYKSLAFEYPNPKFSLEECDGIGISEQGEAFAYANCRKYDASMGDFITYKREQPKVEYAVFEPNDGYCFPLKIPLKDLPLALVSSIHYPGIKSVYYSKE